MKVLMINSVCGIRSTGRICTDLATALESQGHEVKIAYGREKVPEEFQKYAVRIGTDLDVKMHGVLARVLDGAGFGSKSATRKFIQWVKDYNPDVIHLHNLHGYYINLEVLFNYLRTSGKKIIWTLHDCWAFTGHSAYCDAVGCVKWRTGCNNCPNVTTYPKSYTDHSEGNWKRKRDLLTGISNLTIVTPSNWLAGLVKESFLSEYPVEVIHNGIDTNQFHPMKNDFRDVYGIGEKFMLLGVAVSWDDMKGLSDFIQLASKLDDSYQVVLVGVTPEQKASLPQSIITIERTNSVKELAYIYSSADLFLNLSYCENYPTVNLEAMACSTPVLTYKTGGGPESVEEHNGIVIERGNLSAVINAIERFRIANSSPLELNIDTNELDKQSTVKNYQKIIGGYWSFKRSLGLIGKKILLGVASGWDNRKGLHDIVRLAVTTNAQIVIVGITEEQKRSLPKNILAYTRTNDTCELQKLYAVADYYINPTYEDNFPTTNIEALACGTPVITYKTGGSIEAVDTSSGCVVDVGNCQGLLLATNCSYSEDACLQRSKLFASPISQTEYLILYCRE